MKRPASLLLLLASLLAGTLELRAAERLKTGDKLDTLSAGTAVYRNVTIRSIGVRSVTITHQGGMTSVLLRDLSPDLQERFHYDPAAEQAANAAATAKAAAAKQASAAKAAVAAKPSTFDTLLQKFGQPVALSPEVTLRSRFSELGLGVRDQGARPSCAIYAIVCALEFQSAQVTGAAQNFSEEYLIWATRKTTQRVPPNAPLATTTAEPGEEGADEGFVLAEVVVALRAYGVALQEQMPNTRGKFTTIATPSPEVIEAARTQQHVAIHPVPGRDAQTRIVNIIHALNAGVPVPVGIAWPQWRAAKSGFLNAQKPQPNAWHAVTIVGYRAPNGSLEDAQFIFKNSWGSSWGQGGYGTVTYRYLQEYLADAVLLELQRRANS